MCILSEIDSFSQNATKVLLFECMCSQPYGLFATALQHIFPSITSRGIITFLHWPEIDISNETVSEQCLLYALIVIQ